MIHLMYEKLKNMRTQAAEISNLEFGHYPFIKDRMTIESSKYERVQEYLLDQHYNNYKHTPLQPNVNPVQIHQHARPPAVIETKTPSKSYREAVCGNKGDDAMSILSKHDPISTTFPFTGGSPNSNKSELTELKTEISELNMQMSGFQSLMTNMLEKDNEFKLKLLEDKAKEREHRVYMEQQAQAREDKMMTFFKSMMNTKKQVPVAVQPGAIVTSPLTSLNSGNNSSNKWVRNNQSGDDPSQQLIPVEMDVNDEQNDENKGINVQEQQTIAYQQQAWQQQQQPQYNLQQYSPQHQQIGL